MTKIYNEYDAFASFYNKYWTAGTPEIMLDGVLAMVKDKIGERADILDVCCGTGNICGELHALGHNVMGLDGSSKMIEHAKENAPQVEFLVADARTFTMDKQFDLITCLFDSVNHIHSEKDLANVFKNCNKYLKSGGYLLFDVNSLKAAEDAVDFEFAEAESDHAIITKTKFNKRKQEITYTITTFLEQPSGLWERSETKIVEKYHKPEMLVDLLKQSGFCEIELADGFHTLGVEELEDRIFICAKKHK